ncbi:YbaB/EbfC family nucleoid-associated protein [Mycobacterium sp. 050128]|uniref:YbaB/EbfC family nucleoid-associated protein n=1 Tax=Mycobacterium sp. 050128 TaxID=3096112 RepID=UPI002ED80D5A
MSTEIHSLLDEVLHQTRHIGSALDEHLHQLNNRTFNGADEAKTVVVTLDGRQRLAGLRIEDGLLRLGAETVARRINEAIVNAQADATAASEADGQQFVELLNHAAGSLKDILGATEAKSG